MRGLEAIVMIQRVGVLDLTSMTEWTNPVMSDPLKVKVGLLAAMLIVAAASRNFWINCLEGLQIDQVARRETVPRRRGSGVR